MTRVEPPMGVRLEVAITQEFADLITREASYRQLTVNEVARRLMVRGHEAEPLQPGTRFAVNLAIGLVDVEVVSAPRPDEKGVLWQDYDSGVATSALLRAWYEARVPSVTDALKSARVALVRAGGHDALLHALDMALAAPLLEPGRYRSPDGVEGTIGEFDAFANCWRFYPDGHVFPAVAGPGIPDGLTRIGPGKTAGWVRLGGEELAG